MAVSDKLQALLQKNFKGDVQISCVSEDLRGKVIVLYGGNNVGKTSQSARFKNPIFLPVEKGLNATNGAITLKTANWSDLKKNGKKLASKDFVDLLQSGEQITIVIDGIERIGTYCKNYLCAKYDVDSIGKANGGYGCWEEYDNLVWTWVDGIISLGYTVVFIGHEKLDKKKDKYIIEGDERNIKPIRDNADIVCYLQSNGVDEKGKVIPSSAYLAETSEYFARSRFTYMDTYIEEFSAESLEETVVKGIKLQNKTEGYNSASFEQQQKIYGKVEESIDDIKEQLKELYEKMDELDMIDNYLEIVAEHLGEEGRVSEATTKQLEALICIRDDVQEKIDEAE
jgi:hypothetical protein